MTRLAVLTIGQSPRVDVMPDIRKELGSEIEIVEYGILDRFEEEEAKRLFYPLENEKVLVSRLRSGREIKMGEEKVHLLVQECIANIEKEGIEKIFLLCTGKFPNYRFDGILIKPFEMIHAVVKTLAQDRKIGLIVPNEKQLNSSIEFWKETDVEVVAKIASPYAEDMEKLKKVACEFKEEELPFIVLDCMGYSVAMKKIVQERSEKPVILSRTLVASIIKELF